MVQMRILCVSVIVALVALTAVSAKTVEQAAIEGGCSTSVANPLSEQLITEMLCQADGSMKSIKGKQYISLGSAAFGWLQSKAADQLLKVVGDKKSTLTINSGLRTLPQQYLLYRWKNLGLCGITAAAAPGRSNHNGGLAIDVNSYSSWTSTMSKYGWKWYGDGDKPHFDYTGSGTEDVRELSTLAFQKLWNANNPNDKISEDGVYGTNTEKRLQQSPIEGFPIGSTCGKSLKDFDPEYETEPVAPASYQAEKAIVKKQGEVCTVVGPKNGTCITQEACLGRAYGGYCPGPGDLFCCVSGAQAPGISYSTNTAGVNLIKEFEGYEPNFYYDSVGIKTIGYGHACHVYDCSKLMAKRASGSWYQVYEPLSEQEASDLLRGDLEKGGYEDCVRDKVTRSTLTSDQFSSLVSFVFNVGCGGFSGSTLLKRVNANAPLEGTGGIREAFLMWNKAGGKVLSGLTRRRNAEADLYGGDGVDQNNDNYRPQIPRVDDNNDGYAGRDCWSYGKKGVCIDTSSQSCSYGTIKTGLCPGPSNIKCCVGQACTHTSSGDGTCMQTSKCTTSYKRGRCPGSYDITCCANSKKKGIFEDYICPEGASFNATIGFCADDKFAWGPFPSAMVQACKQNGGGSQCLDLVKTSVEGHEIRLPRWNVDVAIEARGTEDCPVGTALDYEANGVADGANFLNATLGRRSLGQCVEMLVDQVNNYTSLLVYGGISKDIADACATDDGGIACYSTRWSMKYYAAVTQPRLEFNVETDDSDITFDGTLTDLGNPFIQEQQLLSKELDDGAASTLFLNSAILLIALVLVF
jgi:GH24 family phage-related lysozyme (muramidase)